MTATHPPDSQLRGLVAWLPAAARPYALLARFDRPIGWWLLYWPCAFGVALGGGAVSHWPLLLWFLLGAIAMRGAGCVYNDIVDRDFDAKVARTASRPVASGAVSVRNALLWAVLLSLVGLLVLVQLPRPAQIVALASLILVAAYPFMKRITWWPQAWLGLVFSWGALVAWVAVGGVQGMALPLLYAGCIAWVIGYDTIYALQDIEDDMLVGVKSSARAMGGQVKAGVALCYAAALGLWGGALWTVRPDPLVLVALIPAALQLTGQVVTLDVAKGEDALAKFRSNRFAGLLVFAAMLVVGTAP
ncbi:4-hydroxybenzoate octaprenyltransferase [Sphingopyxis alaskensis]|jgi:4-hydroxybenzoate polyprenyltransferase|uniref:4-hydroxybenzoate octaprenyltransferase n=1 Tax=Sphingopyxis alaskensis (strain DSM 13593 / LMG 18877 / RB2256) TaxID=317655 RepID=Q1GQU2_SPHAL|nr:4-hydroxybenzoate octaprenyltransferase [Sphingopyxis alaskensis]ABF53980.1 4-hydroxybenzoate octaprenyltransferase [Sphingopyxis alaskensis RB2256]MCM3418946.1 4-hydroxybenzoate octaprenyltransferase [Sphingopyxis alaskensis]